MNVLILGGGGREHAIAAGIATSRRLDRLYVAPGNAGTAGIAENIPADLADLDGLVAVAVRRNIDLTIVGPEGPLCAGVVDRFRDAGLSIFGPDRNAARIEGDKAFAKHLMKRALVPTAEARVFAEFDAAKDYIATRDSALVVKAAGLAGGKGVVVCDEPSDAIIAAERMMVEHCFGDAGRTILVEERLTGPELSVFALVDDDTIYVLDTAQDYKRMGDGDTGLNTGGMGAISPAPRASPALLADVERSVLVPIVDAMRGEGITYRGVLYAGLILTAAGPKVLEFNCRFGDPEAQALLPRVQTDLVDLFSACCAGRLASLDIRFDPAVAVTVVMASGGYPGAFTTGHPVTGLVEAADTGAQVFCAGMRLEAGGPVTSGGRVLSVTGLGADVSAAGRQAYAGVERISFENAYYRSDIGLV